jgi:hypothetical protein
MRDAGLRVLVDAERARELATERQAAHRRRQGVQDRAAHQAAANKRAANVVLLRNEGLPWAEIARRLDLPSSDAARMLASRRDRTIA